MLTTTETRFNELFETYVAPMGKSTTLAGELVRAAAKLRYDFYNNGMGNNTSGAINFLGEFGVFPEYFDDETFSTIHYYTRGRTYTGRYNNDNLHSAIDSMLERTVEYVDTNELALKNTTDFPDMYDLGEDDIDFCEECGDELDGMNESGMGHICYYCYDHWEEEEEEYA